MFFVDSIVTMKKIIFVNAVLLRPYALENFNNGPSALDRVLDKASTFNDCPLKIICREEELDFFKQKGLDCFVGREESRVSFFKALQEAGKDVDVLFLIQGDCPALDLDLFKQLWEDHQQFLAQYSFVDGFPEGLCGEILNTEILGALLQLAEKAEDQDLERKAVFQLMQDDINSFDIYTLTAEKDQRPLRLSLDCSTKSNFLLTEKILEQAGEKSRDICHYIDQNPSILRSLPLFFPLQICGGQVQLPFYDPRHKNKESIINNKEYMSRQKLVELVKKLHDFSPEAVVSLSFFCDPVLHPEIEAVLQDLSPLKDLILLIETAGIGWDSEMLQRISVLWGKRLNWVLYLDALDMDLYESIRGKGYKQAYSAAEDFLRIFPQNTWVQATRMKENEENLEQFYHYWKEKTSRIIIQKYDWSCGRLPDRKLTDLSPVQRQPCWHIKRDMPVCLDGSVLLCGEDLDKEYLLGDIFKESIPEIWQKGQYWHEKHCREEYPEICRKCDEYYTFNF